MKLVNCHKSVLVAEEIKATCHLPVAAIRAKYSVSRWVPAASSRTVAQEYEWAAEDEISQPSGLCGLCLFASWQPLGYLYCQLKVYWFGQLVLGPIK